MTSIGATDGSLAMAIGQNTAVVRSITYMEKGSIEFDYHINRFGSEQFIELQAAYKNTEEPTEDSRLRSPISIKIDFNGAVYYIDDKGIAIPTGLYLAIGDNTISMDFDGNAKKATMTVNGDKAELGFSGNDTYICFVTIFTKLNTTVSLDRFIAIKND